VKNTETAASEARLLHQYSCNISERGRPTAGREAESAETRRVHNAHTGVGGGHVYIEREEYRNGGDRGIIYYTNITVMSGDGGAQQPVWSRNPMGGPFTIHIPTLRGDSGRAAGLAGRYIH